MQKAPEKSAYSKYCWIRPAYDGTAIYAELNQEEADYVYIESQLRGIASALYELGLDSVDESGDDLGDNVDDWNLD